MCVCACVSVHVCGAFGDRISVCLRLLSTFSELACDAVVVWLTDRMDTRTLTSSETMRKTWLWIHERVNLGGRLNADTVNSQMPECSNSYATRAAVKNKEGLMFFPARHKSSCDATCCIFNPSHALLKLASDDEPQSQGRTLCRIYSDFLLISDERKDSLREQVGLVMHVNRQMG